MSRPSPANDLNANDQCKLQEIVVALRHHQPHMTKADALSFSVVAAMTPDRKEAVNDLHATLLDNGEIRRTRCVRR